jgi:hypothetical protein
MMLFKNFERISGRQVVRPNIAGIMGALVPLLLHGNDIKKIPTLLCFQGKIL